MLPNVSRISHLMLHDIFAQDFSGETEETFFFFLDTKEGRTDLVVPQELHLLFRLFIAFTISFKIVHRSHVGSHFFPMVVYIGAGST